MHWQREVPKHKIDPQIGAKFKLSLGHFIAAIYSAYWGMMEGNADRDFWYKQGDNYPFMSWIWHYQRGRGEASTSKLRNALTSFLGTTHQWKFSPQDAVDSFTDPVTSAVGEGRRQLDRLSNPKWYDEEGNVRPAIAYIPFEILDEDSGKQHQGFKWLYTQKLRTMFPGSRTPSADTAWSQGFDFYGREFEKAGIRLLEMKPMPWPPWSEQCITADWIIGCTHIDVFRDESKLLRSEWHTLQQRGSD